MEVGVGGAGPSMSKEEDDELAELPPGFRFHPTDEEIIMHYLLNKVVDRRFSAKAIGEADLNKSEPWDLPKKAKMGEKEWFFFCQRDRKYPSGMRTNRATESGYWKATGKDKEIHRGRTKCLVGMKKTLVFYKGRAPKGEKTNWVMHEYRLEGNFTRAAKEEFVVCRVFHKNSGIRRSPAVELTTRIQDHLLHPPLIMEMDYVTSFFNHHHQTSQYHDFDFAPQMINSLPTPLQQQQHFSNSHSQDTGLSTENVANHEITSKINTAASAFDDIDLDTLWTY